MGKSARDKCFEDEIKKNGKNLDVTHQRDWVRRDGKWEMLKENKYWFAHWLNVTRGKYQQWRTPDMTIRTPDGRTVVVDNKFEGDDWGKTKGMGGKNQRQDHNDMNKQQNPGRKDVKNVALTPESCECNGKNKPQKSPATNPATQPYMLFSPAPGALPALPGFSLPEIPILEPIPVFP